MGALDVIRIHLREYSNHRHEHCGGGESESSWACTDDGCWDGELGIFWNNLFVRASGQYARVYMSFWDFGGFIWRYCVVGCSSLFFSVKRTDNILAGHKSGLDSIELSESSS